MCVVHIRLDHCHILGSSNREVRKSGILASRSSCGARTRRKCAPHIIIKFMMMMMLMMIMMIMIMMMIMMMMIIISLYAQYCYTAFANGTTLHPFGGLVKLMKSCICIVSTLNLQIKQLFHA